MTARLLACLLAAALAALAGREHIQLLGQLANARADLAAERACARHLRNVIALAPFARRTPPPAPVVLPLQRRKEVRRARA